MNPIDKKPLLVPWVGGSFERLENFEDFTADFRDILVGEAIRGYAIAGRGILMCNKASEDCVAVMYATPDEGQIESIYGAEAAKELETYNVLSEAMIGAFVSPIDDGQNVAWLKRFSRERVTA